MGVSRTTFRERVRGGFYPKPVKEGSRLLWSRRELDLYVDAQFKLAHRTNDALEDTTWADFR
jgi:predicted DNA-binding transcriptional regulator AlpA